MSNLGAIGLLTVYRVLHFLGLILVFMSLGAYVLHAINDGVKANNSFRKVVGASHGVGLFLLLLGGFGMLARMKLGFEIWVYIKIGIWFVLGGIVVIINRKPETGKVLWWLVPLLGTLAIYTAVAKPFLSLPGGQ